jgi:hypothetical protein
MSRKHAPRKLGTRLTDTKGLCLSCALIGTVSASHKFGEPVYRCQNCGVVVQCLWRGDDGAMTHAYIRPEDIDPEDINGTSAPMPPFALPDFEIESIVETRQQDQGCQHCGGAVWYMVEDDWGHDRVSAGQGSCHNCGNVYLVSAPDDPVRRFRPAPPALFRVPDKLNGAAHDTQPPDPASSGTDEALDDPSSS